jgi:hypothetical protein
MLTPVDEFASAVKLYLKVGMSKKLNAVIRHRILAVVVEIAAVVVIVVVEIVAVAAEIAINATKPNN